MKYILFDVKEFAEDDDFIRWVKYSTPESNFFWNSFLAEFPEKKKTISDARTIVEALKDSSTHMPENEVKDLRDYLNESFDHYVSAEIKRDQVGSEKSGLPILKIAAVFLLFVLSCAVFFITKRSLKHSNVSYTEKISSNGQRSSVLLPDGSKVWLNGGSKVRYTNAFDSKEVREVFLEGEAFFEVVKNKNRPFIVDAQGLKIKVLGTKFNVKSYQMEGTVETTLIEGSVSIKENKKDVILKPNEKAIFSKKEKQLKLFKANPKKDVAWKEGQLVIENDNFEEVVQKLERWYGVELVLKGGSNCIFKFKITGESLIDVLESMKLAKRISYTVVKDKIIIEAMDCDR